MPTPGIDETVIAVALMVGDSSTLNKPDDSTTFAAKSSMLGYVQIKPNAPKHCARGPTKNLLRYA